MGNFVISGFNGKYKKLPFFCQLDTSGTTDTTLPQLIIKLHLDSFYINCLVHWSCLCSTEYLMEKLCRKSTKCIFYAWKSSKWDLKYVAHNGRHFGPLYSAVAFFKLREEENKMKLWWEIEVMNHTQQRTSKIDPIKNNRGKVEDLWTNTS